MLRPIVCGVPMVYLDRWDPAVAAQLVARFRVTQSGGTPYFMHSLVDAARRGGHDLSSIRAYSLGATGVTRSSSVTPIAGLGRGPHLRTHRALHGDALRSRHAVRQARLHRRHPAAGHVVRIVDAHMRDSRSAARGSSHPRARALHGLHRRRLNATRSPPAAGSARATWAARRGGLPDHHGSHQGHHHSRRREHFVTRSRGSVAAFPAVKQVAVIGMPDERYGERVCAVVVAKPGSAPPLGSARQQCLDAGLARFKVPAELLSWTSAHDGIGQDSQAPVARRDPLLRERAPRPGPVERRRHPVEGRPRRRRRQLRRRDRARPGCPDHHGHVRRRARHAASTCRTAARSTIRTTRTSSAGWTGCAPTSTPTRRRARPCSSAATSTSPPTTATCTTRPSSSARRTSARPSAIGSPRSRTWGLSDVFRAAHPEDRVYSWWDYRAGDFHQGRGLRIDLVLCSAVGGRAGALVRDRPQRPQGQVAERPRPGHRRPRRLNEVVHGCPAPTHDLRESCIGAGPRSCGHQRTTFDARLCSSYPVVNIGWMSMRQNIGGHQHPRRHLFGGPSAGPTGPPPAHQIGR